MKIMRKFDKTIIHESGVVPAYQPCPSNLKRRRESQIANSKSLITNHQLPITNYQSPVFWHQSHFKILFLLILILVFAGCDKWDKTSDVSHETYLPEFEFIGGDFLSFIRSEQKFIDPGVRAKSNGEAINVLTFNPDMIPDSISEAGVFIIKYYAENSEGFSNTADRVIAVTYEDVTENDLSGTYSTSFFGEVIVSRITKVDDKGLYKSEDVLGFPGSPMPGRFVDLGQNNLVMLPGEGNFGNYDISEGRYTRNSLSWTVILLDEPNKGISINIVWVKND